MNDLSNEQVLIKSCVRKELWDLLKTDPSRFKDEVRKYFAKTYPDWSVVTARPSEKLILLRDERGRNT